MDHGIVLTHTRQQSRRVEMARSRVIAMKGGRMTADVIEPKVRSRLRVLIIRHPAIWTEKSIRTNTSHSTRLLLLTHHPRHQSAQQRVFRHWHKRDTHPELAYTGGQVVRSLHQWIAPH
jgi:hypothetical protein